MSKAGGKKKSKVVKKLKRRADSWVKEDVQASTSIPPKVDGQLRCYLRLSVNQVLWMIPNSPELTHVRVQWWGEEVEGTIFRPVDVKKGKKGGISRTNARFPVRSGPKQLAAYFNDMGSLVLEVLSGPLMVTVGRAQVDHISRLAPNRPINGFFSVFSADTEKVAELQVAIVLESLMASYDSSSSIPTPDMSSNIYAIGGNDIQPNNPSMKVVPAHPPAAYLYSSTDDPFTSPAAIKQQSGRTTPCGIDSQIFGSHNQLRDSVQSRSSALSHMSGHTVVLSNHQGNATDNSQSTVSRERSTTTTHPVTSGGYGADTTPTLDGALGTASTLQGISTLESQLGMSKPGSPRRGSLPHLDASSDVYKRQTAGFPSSDLVSVLLQRGGQLREAMIASTLNTPEVRSTSITDMEGVGMGIYSPLRKPAPLRRSSTGSFLKEILTQQSPEREVESLEQGQVHSEQFDQETWALKMVLGDEFTAGDDMLMHAYHSQSGSDAGNDLSDFGDPLHDDDILEELFYKEVGDDSDISVSDNDEMKTKTWGATDMSLMSMDEAANLRPASQSSLDMEPVRDCGHIRSSPMERHIHVQSSSGERKRNERSPPREKKRRNNNISVERKRNGSHSPGEKKRNDSRSPGEKKRNRKGKAHHDIKTMNESQNITDLPEQMSISYTPSEAEQMSTVGKTGNDAPVEGLSVQRLTLLGRIDVARVVIDRLRLHDEMNSSRETTPTKGMVNRGRVKGKPPRPVRTKKASTYFVEYQFPVVTTSKVMSQPNIMATEVMRVASKKVVNGDVSYNHRSVFPVQFDQESIEKWWTIALVFKIYCRRPNQKVPQLIGMCSVPLKSVLKSEALFLEKIIDIKERTDPCVHMSDSPFIGNLKVSIELASYGKDFSTALAKTRLAEMTDAKVVPIPVPKPKKPLPPPQSFPNGQEQTATQTEPRPVNLDRVPHAPPPGPPAWTGVYSHPQPSQTPAYQLTGNFENASIKDYEESLTLHSLLLIPEGENISPCGTGQPLRPEGKYPQHPVSFRLGRDAATRNLYLVCRMFWCDDVVNSNVCWGTSNPKFNFAQVEPILLTMSLLERLRNNFLVIEVWDKKTSAKSDELVGILKLPLHQFYMSYRDRRIAASLLKSQYPVVSVDSHMPIVSPFSGTQFGKLKVLLAMGSQTQIGNLQRMMQDKGSAVAIPERPSHCLERQHLYGEARTAEDYAASTDNMVEHVFEVGVESVKGLRLRDNMIWGEADCFIQYHFPTQMTSKHQGAPQIMHATPSLKTFRTATTLCIPDPVFNDLVRHKIVMPEGTPVQREILNACAGVGGGAGGIPLEVWCRYYYPNVRDQVIAKATLPLAKLCALVTMQKRGEANVQTFTLPLSSIVISDQEDDHEAAAKIEDSGLLEVTINYKSHILKGVSELHRPDAVNQGRPGATVCVSVGVIRASGLKMAASALARLDQGMQYPAEVGVNSYIRVRMSHLGKEDERVTRTVARTFAPEFNFYLDFPSPLLWTQPGSDALSLAEILETAEVTFDLWHQIPGSDIEVDRHYVNTGSADVCGRKLVPVSGDVLLGSISLPLRGLLTHKTGINGWFPMNLPSVGWDIPADDGRHGNRGIERVIGGLELSLKFGHHDDLERLEQAARGVGWAPDFDIGHRDWDEADELLDQYHQVAVAVDLACFPLQNALVIGQTKLDAAARCYVRYKFYDRNAVCSKLQRPDLNEDDYLSVHVQHSKTLVIPGSSPFTWYLREERLEIQVWVTYTSENAEKQRPRNRDKLIGSAYIDLSSLADTRRRHHRVSDLYPLFKPGTSSLGGACIRAHVTLTPRATGYQLDDESDDEGDMYSPRKDDCKSKKSSPKKKLDADKTDNVLTVDLENTFMVHVSIERALHMPWVSEEGNDVPPSCYVSYQTSNESDSTHTDICMANDDPVWKHEHDARFHRDLLTQANKNLVFKVWHKPRGVRQEPDKGVDKVLGFVSVDLSLLLRGFHRLTGWYNIINFSGDCQGQIKVSVVPQESLQRFQGLITTPTPEPTDGSEFTTPLDPSMAPFPHFSEHYENVKRCHLRLHDTMLAMGGADPSTASRSTLRSNLRDNIQELDEMTNRLKERLQVQSSSPAPFSSSVVHPQSTSQDKTGTTSYAAPTSVPAVSTTSETLHLAVPLQPFASDSLENVHSAQPRPESQIPTTSINDGSGQFLEIANQGDTDLSTIEGATVEGACVYESALKNARQMLQNIDQHMRASPATGTLTVSATYELVSGDATPPCDASDETDTTAATMTRHAHFEEQGDDTLAPFWNRSYEYDDDDADDEDVTVVEARPLNDVSSANFCNGLPNAVLIREQTTFTEINSTSSRTNFSVDYSMDNEVEDEFDYRGRPYAPGGSTSDDFGGDWGSRLGACMHGLNYNVNSNVGATETATHENGSADGNSDDVDGNHSANGTDAEHDGSGEVGLKETSHKAAKPTRGTLKHQGTAHGIGSSSEEEEEEREVRNRHGTAHETVCDDRVHGETRNEKVNGMSSVHSSEHSRKSSDSSQDSRNRQNPASSNHSSEHSRKSSSSSQDSRNCQNQVLSIHSSEHSQKSPSSSQNRENAKSPLDVVKDDVVDTNDDVFSVDEIDGDANHERDLQTGGNTPSDSLSPDRAYKKPPASPRKGGEYDTVPTTTRGATTTAVPNFFLPLPHMEQTMRALRTAMTNDTRDQSRDKTRPGDADNHRDQSVPVIDNYASRFSSVATKTRAQPSAEQAQRIAKIFSQRFA